MSDEKKSTLVVLGFIVLAILNAWAFD